MPLEQTAKVNGLIRIAQKRGMIPVEKSALQRTAESVAEKQAQKQERMVNLYHRTSPEAADAIEKGGHFKPGYNGYAYFSTRKNEGSQYGKATVAIQIPKSEMDKMETHWFGGGTIVVAHPDHLKAIGITPKRIK